MGASHDISNFTLIRCSKYLKTPKSDRLLPGPKDKRLINDYGSTSLQLPQVWHRGLIEQGLMEDLTIELTAIIYQRLFKNPPISMISSDRVYTLPESDIYAIPQEFPSVRITSESGSSEQSKAAASSSRMGSPPKVHDASTKKCSTETS